MWKMMLAKERVSIPRIKLLPSTRVEDNLK